MKRLPATGIAHGLPVVAFAFSRLLADLTRNYRWNQL